MAAAPTQRTTLIAGARSAIGPAIVLPIAEQRVKPRVVDRTR